MNPPYDGIQHRDSLLRLLKTTETAVWFLLTTLTIISWVLGVRVGGVAGDRIWGTITLLTLAFFKVWLVVRYFMETRQSPWELKWSCDAYVWVSYIVVTGYATGLIHDA